MRTRVSVLALLFAVALAGAAPARGKRPSHPRVDPAAAAEACESCHQRATPAKVEEWQAGAHGLFLVKCFVCHGSLGKDFTVAPAAERCGGCHATELASVRHGKGAAQGCFDCHAPHGLAAGGAPSPHAR